MSEPLPKTEKPRDENEPAAPNTERVGLWRILAFSTGAAAIILIAIGLVVL